ncbi:MAG: TolC family protein [Calditrichaeota bacterium]|nr:MAG: TolC family protein [Calditrichota bacterium]MBL1204113.1 TolC family protein [Calditrichota bacterium]NOG43944.1 TolC family protein [Calditrichota bacterium]
MKKFKLIVALLFLFVASLSAQQKMTLEQSIDIALQENLNIKIAKNENEVSHNNINIGNAGLLPQVNLSASTTYNDNEINNNGIKSNQSYTSNYVGANATYILFDGFNNIASYNQLKTQGKISDYQTQYTIEQYILLVTNSYYQVAGLTDQLNINKESLQISKERLERTSNKKDYGQAKSIDYLSALVDFNNDSVAYINSQTSLIQAKQDFNNLLNRNTDYDFDVDLDVLYKILPSKEDLINTAIERNALYKSSENNIKLAELNIKSANSNFYPQLSVDANYSLYNTQNEWEVNLNDRSKGFSTGLNLSYNLFNGFRNSIQKQNAEINRKNAELEKKNELLSLVTEISNTHQQYEDSKISLKLENDNLEAAELNFNRSKELYNLGQITNTQFRESQLNLIQAKSSISTLRYSIKIFEAELERSAGILL